MIIKLTTAYKKCFTNKIRQNNVKYWEKKKQNTSKTNIFHSTKQKS